MNKALVVCSFVMLTLAPAPSDAKSVSNKHRRIVAPPQHVACTVLGCQPVPPQCVPHEEHTFGGTPTGYDTIVCPPGVWPF